MSIRLDILLVILGLGLVAFLLRFLPFLFLSARPAGPGLTRWLDLIPPAILGAILVPTLLTSPATQEIGLLQPRFLAALPCLIVAWQTRSMALTVLAGMASYWAVQQWV